MHFSNIISCVFSYHINLDFVQEDVYENAAKVVIEYVVLLLLL